MMAVILRMAPEILDRKFADGSTFRASDSFVRAWLHRHLNWSPQKPTRATQKLPKDWERQVEDAFLRM